MLPYIGHLLNPEQLVSSDHNFVHFKGAVVLIESEILFCLDDFLVAPLHSVATITNLPQLGLLPEAPLSKATRGWHLFVELLVGGLDCCLLDV